MADNNKKTRIRRISRKLDNLIDGLKNKNDIKFVEASDFIANMILKQNKKKKIIENIRREIEF
jgi:hypothetical protein